MWCMVSWLWVAIEMYSSKFISTFSINSHNFAIVLVWFQARTRILKWNSFSGALFEQMPPILPRSSIKAFHSWRFPTTTIITSTTSINNRIMVHFHRKRPAWNSSVFRITTSIRAMFECISTFSIKMLASMISAGLFVCSCKRETSRREIGGSSLFNTASRNRYQFKPISWIFRIHSYHRVHIQMHTRKKANHFKVRNYLIKNWLWCTQKQFASTAFMCTRTRSLFYRY